MTTVVSELLLCFLYQDLVLYQEEEDTACAAVSVYKVI